MPTSSDDKMRHESAPSSAGERRSDDADATRNPASSQPDVVQGEGDYDAAREFNAAEQEFVASGKVREAARAAAPKSEAEQAELLEAERLGKERARK